MYISHFTKWTWFKIYLAFYKSAYWKYVLPHKNKNTLIYCLLFAIPLSIYLIPSELFLVICFWMLMLSKPLITLISFVFLFSPKTLICYKEFPSEPTQEKINNSFINNKEKLSIDFYRNTLNKSYDLLLETSEYYFIYRNQIKALESEPSIILVINKKENQSTLGDNNQLFLEFIRPKCKKYINKG